MRKRVHKEASDQSLWARKRKGLSGIFASKGIAGVFAVLATGGTVTGGRKYSADLAQGELEVLGLVSRARLQVRVWPARLFPDLYFSRQR